MWCSGGKLRSGKYVSMYKLFPVMLLASLVPLQVQDSFACSCNSDPDFLAVWAESDGAFQGTVMDVTQGEGPRKVTFDIHLVLKGSYPYGKYVLEDSSVVYLEWGAVRHSSCEVYYKVGETYQVFVYGESPAGSTGICTTKQISGFEEYSREGQDGQVQHRRQNHYIFDQYGFLSLIVPSVAISAIVAGALVWRQEASRMRPGRGS